jgi:glycosyltransferase involved in cell wall biosynthesis
MKKATIIPGYNAESFIERLSKIPDVYFLDDASTDNTHELLHFHNIPHRINLKNVGNNANHNIALEWAKELNVDVVRLMHADDYPIFKKSAGFEAAYQYNSLTSSAYITHRDGIPEGLFSVKGINGAILRIGESTFRKILYEANIIGPPPSWFIPKSIFTQYSFDETLGPRADVDFLLNIGMTHTIFYIAFPLTWREVGRDTSITNQTFGESAADTKTLIERYGGFYGHPRT